MQAEHREVQLAADAQAEQQLRMTPRLGVGQAAQAVADDDDVEGLSGKAFGQGGEFGGDVGNLVAPAGGQDAPFDFLVELRLVGQDDLGFQAGEARCQVAMLVGYDEDGNTMIDTLALDAFLERQAFQFVSPGVPGIGVNMLSCSLSCPRFILHDARSA
jgi:hypothetical protein